MEYICEVCRKTAEVFCSCDTSLQYCYGDFDNFHQKTQGEHNAIKITSRRQEINQKFVSTIENLDKVKMEIITRSNELIHSIQIVTKSKLFSIKKYIGCCKKALKSCELDAEKVFKDFENIKI